MQGDFTRISRASRDAIFEAEKADAVFVSVISVWEIGLLVSKRRLKLTMPVSNWVAAALGSPGVNVAPFTPEIALESVELPGDLHRDPADRILVATARIMKVRLLTADRTLIEYAGQGHLNVLPA